jgi:hypothetical protein
VNVGRELLYNSTGLKKNVEIAATKAAALIK